MSTGKILSVKILLKVLRCKTQDFKSKRLSDGQMIQSKLKYGTHSDVKSKSFYLCFQNLRTPEAPKFERSCFFWNKDIKREKPIETP